MRRNLITEARIECEEHGSKSHASTAPVCRVPVPFELAICALMPWSNSPRHDLPRYPGRTASLRQILREAPYDTIKKWRAGRRNPPEWAVDALTAKLDSMIRQASEAARLLRESKKPAPARTGLKER